MSPDLDTLNTVAKELRRCNVMIEIESCSHLPSHNCYLVNDIFLLSYTEAAEILRRSKAASYLAGKASAAFERLSGWVLQFIYRACYAGQQTKMEAANGRKEDAKPDAPA